MSGLRTSAHEYDMIAITETWLQSDQVLDLSIHWYLTFQKDKKKDKGGGVALLTKDAISTVKRNYLSSEQQNVESFWGKIRNSK